MLSDITVKPNMRLHKLLTEKEKVIFLGESAVSFSDFINNLEQREEIGDVLFIIRNALELSLRDFARLVGVSHAYIAKLEKKISDPTIPKVFIMADNLNIPRLDFISLFSKK